MNVLLGELMQSWAALLRRPGYLILASLTLALGVGACVSVFSLVNASLLQSPAVPQIDRVVVLGPMRDGSSTGGLAPIAYQHLEDLPGLVAIGIGAPQASAINVSDGDHSATVASWKVSGSFLETLAQPMYLGRGFNREESQYNGPPAAIVTHAYWQQNLGADPAAVNRMLRIDGMAVPLVGVLSPDFPYQQGQILLPLTLQPSDPSWAGDHTVIARLAPGGSYENIAAAVHSRLKQLDELYSMDLVGHRNVVYGAEPLAQALQSNTNSLRVLELFAACAGLVLLIVLVNLTNLCLLRILSRSHDNAVRTSLGAPTLRLLLPATAEQLLIAAAGSSIGLFVAWGSLRLAAGVIPADWFISAVARPKIGWDSILFALCLGAFLTLVALSIGAWRAYHAPIREALVSGGRSGSERHVGRMGRMLVILQAALATVLLLVAALYGRTIWEASQVDYGVDNRNVLAFTVKPDRRTYPRQQEMIAMADAMVARLETIPGIIGAAYGTDIPASGSDFHDTVPLLTPDGASIDAVLAYIVSPRYLEVLGVDVQHGAPFERAHTANADALLISAELQKLAPKYTALGEQLALPYNYVNPQWANHPLQIRGVTGDVRALGPRSRMPPVAWIPFMANSEHLYDVWRDVDSLYFIIRVQGDPASYIRQVAAAAYEIAPNLPIAGLRPLSEYQADSLARERLNLLLIGIFACVALLLASEGMYSVMAVSVASRTHELGIRGALGAQPLRLMREVLVDGGVQTGIGLLIGLSVALAASRVIQRFLFGIEAVEPLAILVVVIVLATAGLLACLAPAVRASRVQPMEALRTQ